MVVFDRNAPYEQFIFIDADEYGKMYRDIREVSKEVSSGLRRTITKAVRPITLEVRKAALAIPSGGEEVADSYNARKMKQFRVGLRTGIAAATEQKVVINQRSGFGIRIRVSGSKFAAVTHKTRTLPRYMEGLGQNFQRWRHPIWVPYSKMPGPPGRWASQQSHPYLLPTANRHKNDLVKAVEDAFDQAMRAVGFK